LADVFLSYARPDAGTATRVARELGKAGHSVWFDRELPAHRAYSDVIATEIESAAAVLVLWSVASAGSQWVRSEANRARELGKLVEARLDDARLPMPFDQIQCADLRGWRGGRAHSAWSQVLRSIDALRGGRAATQMLPELRQAPDRRAVLVGGGAIGIAAIVGGAWFWRRAGSTDRPSPEAALLLQKGVDMLQNNDVFAADNPGSLEDAVALLTEATQADPQSAEAWGSLALAYAALKRVSPAAELAGLDVRSRSAAGKALAIDPHEPRATGALLLIRPLYGQWADAERADRAALRNAPPHMPLLLFVMAEMLGSVGRGREAAATATQFDRKSFIIPGADERILLHLWTAGDLQGADEALRLAVQHWPQHPQVWRTRLAYLMYSGRASEALELLQEEGERPAGTSSDLVEVTTATAKALIGQQSATEAVARNIAYLKVTPTAVFQTAHACAALGDPGTLFAILEGYYFGRGAWAALAPPAGDYARQTSGLFEPPMRPVWKLADFRQLTQRTGLEAYWRESGTIPDFRR
jgi:tetratricopeptide (TPR) repeat protein